MRTTIAPVSAAERRAAAAAFGAWLRDHPLERQALRDRRLTLGQLIERSGMAISSSSAYRLALRLGLVGRRRNRCCARSIVR